MHDVVIKKDTTFKAQWREARWSHYIIPRVCTWNGYSIYGYYCPASSLSPGDIVHNGTNHSIGQFIASTDWGEVYQCGLICYSLGRDVKVDIEGCGSFILTYRSDYRYISFQRQDCIRVANYLGAHLGDKIGIKFQVL